MTTPSTQREDTVRLMAFYEIAQRASLTNHPDLIRLPVFQKAKELHEAREQYLREGGFTSKEAVDDWFRLRLEGGLTIQGKSWEDVWAEFAPESLRDFPLAPGSL
jgi:hypothetical protein